jgi:hypothetical protein
VTTRQITSRNGAIPADEMTRVGTDNYDRPAQFLHAAAASWLRMRDAGMPHNVNDTYRDLARQRAYYENPPNGAGLAAKPGTSWHGEGLAVDADGACLTWLAAHGRPHGWVRTIAAETWHFEYMADQDTHQGDEMPLSQSDLEAVREASANGAALLYAEMAAGSTPRGRQARDSLRVVISGALTGLNPVARQTLTKELLDGIARRLSQ